MNDRRKSDRRVPPAVAQHAIEERSELLARIEELESKCAGWKARSERRVADIKLLVERHANELAALKAQPSGAVDAQRLLVWNRAQPEPRPITIGREYQVADACSRLNSPPVSAGGVYSGDPLVCSGCVSGCFRCRGGAGVVDELAFDTEKGAVLFCEARGIDDESPYRDRALDAFVSGAAWQARAALTAQPDHSERNLHMVPDGWRLVPVNSTEAIRNAIDLLCDDGTAFDDSEAFWHFLLAAAPSPGKQEGE